MHPVFRPGRAGPAWVEAAGELDITSSHRLERALGHTMERELLVLDPRELVFIDGSGVHVILDAAVRARLASRRLLLISICRQVDRMLAVTGARHVLDVVDFDVPKPPRMASAPVPPTLDAA